MNLEKCPLFRSKRTELIFGFALFTLASLILYDAFNRKGKGAPWPLGAILPF